VGLVKRNILKQVQNDLKDIDAVFINGARQVGKSTFVESFADHCDSVHYATFDDISIRAAELNCPGSTFKSIKEGLIILDEVQLVPASFLAIKEKIDDVRRKKQNLKFLLTGSSDIMLYPKLSEALVGRMYIRTMYPFSYSESTGKEVNFVKNIFNSCQQSFKKYTAYSFDKIISKATFPKLSLDIENKSAWCGNYISTLIEKDVRNISDIDKIGSLLQLLNILANRVGGLLNESSLANASKLSLPTLRRYRALFEGVFLISLLPPWLKNIEKRFVKSQKLYFNDTMLLCYLLGLNPNEIELKRPDLYGFILENFVFSELKKQISLFEGYSLYHFRTSDQKEIDFVIEHLDGSLAAIEIKASNIVKPEDFKHIRFLKENMPDKFVKGIVLYKGDKVVQASKDIYAMPISSLWE
jgi:predicted AAA+ superfamily ATPase